MNITEDLNKDEIHTFIGTYYNNIFNTLSGDEIDCLTYRCLLTTSESSLCVVNMKYIESPYTKRWTIFQVAPLNEDDFIKNKDVIPTQIES